MDGGGPPTHEDGTAGDSSATSASSGATAAVVPTVSVPTVTGLHGVVTPYDGNQEEWSEYAERLENYFIANELEDVAKRRAILLNGVGAPTYRLIKTLALPARRRTSLSRRSSNVYEITLLEPETLPNNQAIRIQHEEAKRGRDSS